MHLPEHITEVAVSILVDTGVSHSFVSAKFAAMTRFYTYHDMPVVVQMPTGRSETINLIFHCKLLIENVVYT